MLTSDLHKLLPIGSIVLLKEAEKKLMIFGIRQTDQDTGREYDYVGVLYPEGNMGENLRFLFDHDDIQDVVYLGYNDEERVEFLQNLKNYFDAKDAQV